MVTKIYKGRAILSEVASSDKVLFKTGYYPKKRSKYTPTNWVFIFYPESAKSSFLAEVFAVLDSKINIGNGWLGVDLLGDSKKVNEIVSQLLKNGNRRSPITKPEKEK